jgi:hypothetical protein
MSKRSLNIPVPIPFETIVDLPDGGVRVPRTFTAPAAAARPVEEGRRAERYLVRAAAYLASHHS